MSDSSIKSAESYRKSNHESHLEVDDVTYRSGVYKILMVRMFRINKELTNFRMYGSKPGIDRNVDTTIK